MPTRADEDDERAREWGAAPPTKPERPLTMRQLIGSSVVDEERVSRPEWWRVTLQDCAVPPRISRVRVFATEAAAAAHRALDGAPTGFHVIDVRRVAGEGGR
jgi:hypothetical protein